MGLRAFAKDKRRSLTIRVTKRWPGAKLPSLSVVIHLVVVELIVAALWQVVSNMFVDHPLVKDIGTLVAFCAALMAVAWYLPKLQTAAVVVTGDSVTDPLPDEPLEPAPLPNVEATNSYIQNVQVWDGRLLRTISGREIAVVELINNPSIRIPQSNASNLVATLEFYDLERERQVIDRTIVGIWASSPMGGRIPYEDDGQLRYSLETGTLNYSGKPALVLVAIKEANEAAQPVEWIGGTSRPLPKNISCPWARSP